MKPWRWRHSESSLPLGSQLATLGRHYTSLNGGQICVQSQDEIDGIHRSFSKTYRCSTLQLFIFCIVLEPEALHDLHKWRRNSMGARTHGAISEEKWLSASQKLQPKMNGRVKHAFEHIEWVKSKCNISYLEPNQGAAIRPKNCVVGHYFLHTQTLPCLLNRFVQRSMHNACVRCSQLHLCARRRR